MHSTSTFPLGYLMLLLPGLALAADPLALSAGRAVELALDGELGLARITYQMSAQRELAVAEGALPDPQITLTAQNLPVDSFELDQEPMTQLRIGLRQSIPRGSTRRIRGELRSLESARLERLRDERRLEVTRDVRHAWLNVYFEESVSALLDESAPLFSELERVTQSVYSVGGGSQQDLLRARLERHRLDERVMSVEERIRRARTSLARWIDSESAALPMSGDLPDWQMPDLRALAHLARHPIIRAVDLDVESSRRKIALARQAYKPALSVEVAYGYRQGNAANGDERPDFFSAMLSMDMPLFRGKRQDRRVAASHRESEAVQSSREDRLRELAARFQRELARHESLMERLRLFDRDILPTSRQAAEAALRGYRTDTNDFAEVMRAYIAELDARIDYERLRVQHARSVADLAYFVGDQEGEAHE